MGAGLGERMTNKDVYDRSHYFLGLMVMFLRKKVHVFYCVGSTYMLNACPTEIDFDIYQPRNPKGKITDVIIENMRNWHHSGFSVY